MRDSLRHVIRSSFFEAAFVVFGVVVALAANEWRESVSDRERADSAWVSIVAELELNLSLVRESRQNHETEIALIQERLRKEESLTQQDFQRGYISPAWVSANAWEVAKETGVLTDFDYGAVLSLSSTYDRLGRYEDQVQMVSGLLYDKIFNEGAGAVISAPEKSHVNSLHVDLPRARSRSGLGVFPRFSAELSRCFWHFRVKQARPLPDLLK